MTTSTEDDSLWIRRFQPARPNAPRLLCLPHAGGSASFYFSTAQALAPDVEVLAVQYPGRQDRRAEPCVPTVPELAARLHNALGAWTDRPLAIFGHSMGAVVGFELAGLLERESDQTPTMLFASGRRAPSRFHAEYVHEGSDDMLIAEMKKLSGTDSRILGDEELLRMVLSAVRADYKAVETYQPAPGTPPLSCPIAVLTGDSDPRTTLDDAAAWREHTTAGFGLRVFPGGHFFLTAQAQPVLAHVTEQLAAVVAR
ncbi:thioesterase [Streptomyces sp. MUSC 14]|uniref:thioesterase II family protein n=1 Tax=Streptomyces sp. MUSC 14 TaxID=1354889 RepID=UPI0008F5E052|nr:alpha/beta fold hydrolase [Streptomyces sp. MUSC 14]OIJ90606.1 thioesterase [Streptomyces sp. MUSC 14]